MIKKSLLLTLLLAVFAPWAANAQETETLTIGTGTNWSDVGSNGGQGYGSAFGNPYYYNSAAQFIYTADELEGVGTIHSVAFYHNAYTFSATVKIYLFHTTATTVDPNAPVTEGTPVFSETITLGASDEGWQTFSFGDNAFEYNGTDNLLVVVCREKYNSGYSNYQKWQYTATEDNKFMVRSSDTNGYGLITNTSTYFPFTSRPNIQIEYVPVQQGDCPRPSQLQANNVTAHEAVLTWEGPSDYYYWQYKKATSENWADGGTVDEQTYTLTGLDPETAYIFAVASDCDPEVSGYREITFTTGIACYAPTDLDAALTLGNGSIATLSWTSDASAWVVAYKTADDEDFTEVNVTENPYTLIGLTPETAYTAKVKAVCGGNDGASQWSSTVTFTPTDAYTLTVNDGTTTNGFVPIYGYYVDSYTRSQFIIPAEDLAAMQWGSINKMTFYASADKDWGAQFKVYLTETCETTLSELYDWDDMQEVYVGTPAIVGNKMEIVFNTPYQYTGGNLLVGFFQTTTGSYSNCNWYGVTANGASLGGYNTSISQRNFLPKTTFEFVPGEEPACVPASCLAASNISFTNVTLNWFQSSSANLWNVAISTDGENFATVEAETNVDYLLENLTPSTEYTVKVSPANCEAWSNTITFTTLDPCLTPTNLTATEIEAHTAVLSWTENGLSEAWVVEITDVEGGQITTWDADTISITVSGLTPETDYSARVRPACDESLWSTAITFTTEEACPAPTSLAVTDGSITNSGATVTWSGTSQSYVVMIGETIIVLGTANFENQTIPSNWTNDASYPWVITDAAAADGTYSMKSGNYHVGGSTSSITITGTYTENTTIEFDARCSSEQTSTSYDWDYGTFYIDGEQQGDKIVNSSTFSHYSYEVEAGTHTFMWRYKKDGSVNNNDDCFYVDNIVNVPVPTVNDWTEYTSDVQTYTFANLTSNTSYQVMVKGDCDEDGLSVEAGPISFATVDLFTKDIVGYGTGNGNWYLIATPIGSIEPANVTNMIADPADDYDLYAWDGTTTEVDVNNDTLVWRNFKTGEFTTLEPGKGYLYANKNTVTLSFIGTPYDGDGTFDLTYDEANETACLNLVGNPYAVTATIDGDRSFYILNSDGDKFLASTSNTIEAMEGIFVVAESEGDQVTFTPETGDKSANLALNLSQGLSIIDRAIVRFDEGGQLPKYQLNPNDTKVYIPQEGKDYAVVSGSEMGEMPVNFKAESNGSYTLSFTSQEVSFNYLHLIDNMTGADVDLLVNPNYSFDANTTDYASRFRLVFATGNNSDDNFAFYSNGSFVISNEGNAVLQVVDVTGRILNNETINGSANVHVDAAPGVYMLRLINGDNVKVQKVVVR